MDVAHPCDSIADPVCPGFIVDRIRRWWFGSLFKLAVSVPILSAAGERRRFIVMRGGSVLAICRRILKVSRRNYCNYYNLKIIHESWIQDIRESQSWRISPWTQTKYKNDLFTRSAALWELRANSVGGSTDYSPLFQLSGSLSSTTAMAFIFSILQDWHPCDVRTSGSVGTWKYSFPDELRSFIHTDPL